MSNTDFKKLSKEMAGKEKNTSSILLLSIVTLVAVILVWASVTEIDSVVRGSGETVSEAQNQLVQSSEPGVIIKRYVNEGDIVEKGQLLFDIDPIDAKTQLDQAQKRFSSLSIKLVRLQAEVDGTEPDFSDDLMMIAGSAVITELALFNARKNDLLTKIAILEQRKVQKLHEIQELKIQVQTASNGLDLIRSEIRKVEPLVRTGLAPETRLIALRREEEAT